MATPDQLKSIEEQIKKIQEGINSVAKEKNVTLEGSGTNYKATPNAPAKLNPQQALLYTVADVNTSAVTEGKPPVSFAEALKLAQNDPNIISKYADEAGLDKQAFEQNLVDLQTNLNVDSETKKMQFENDKKQLAENFAASGAAYSGFRGKAQENLNKSQSGIITSTRSATQKKLQEATSAFESKYGTSATKEASVNYINPSTGAVENLTAPTLGGITGSINPAKQQDINNKALYNLGTTAQPNLNQ